MKVETLYIWVNRAEYTKRELWLDRQQKTAVKIIPGRCGALVKVKKKKQ